MLDSQEKVRELSLALSNLLEAVEQEVVELYESIQNFTEFNGAVLDVALERVSVYRMRKFVKLDFSQLDPVKFEDKYNLIKEEQNVEERGV